MASFWDLYEPFRCNLEGTQAMWRGGSLAALDVVVRLKMELLLQESVDLRSDWDWTVARFLFLKGYLIQLVNC